MRIITQFLFLLSLLAYIPASGQGTQTEFGKNRVQYHQDYDEWVYYESTNFITYWYGEGRNIGQAVVQTAELDHDLIQNLLEHRMNDKIEIIVYTDITDLKQSNIGSEEAFVNTGGQTKIVGNKVFVYFDGDHQNLREQIREGIASVYMNAMLFGSNLQEIVQNAVMMNLPDWFKSGLVSYVGSDWNAEMDNQLRDLIINERYKNFDKLAEDHPKLAGHSLWYFIGQNYGKSTVSNLLYLTRINRSIESGFLYVLGTSYEKTTQSWLLYFNQRYKEEMEGREQIEGEQIVIKNKRKLPLTSVKLSPNGKKLLYVTNEIGKAKVFIQDVRTGERDMIFKTGFRNSIQATDYNYPLVAWSPNNLEVAIVHEKRDVPKLAFYDMNTRKMREEEELSTEYHRVYSVDYITPFNLVFSATVKGFSDIFIYQSRTRQTERITQDFYDDLDATVVTIDSIKGILFVSNRRDSLIRTMKMDTILPLDNFDVFFYDYTNKNKVLTRVTNTPLANERKPAAVDSTYFTYLSDENGIYNRKMAYLEDVILHYNRHLYLKDGSKVILHQDTTYAALDTTGQIDSMALVPVWIKIAHNHGSSNYERSILDQHTAPQSNQLVQLIFKDGEYRLYNKEANTVKRSYPKPTKYQKQKIQTFNSLTGSRLGMDIDAPNPSGNIMKEVDDTAIDITKEEVPQKENGKVDIDNYFFQSEFDNHEPAAEVTVEDDNEKIVVQKQQTIEPVANNGSPFKRTLERKVPKFRSARIVPYRLKFRADFVTTQLDNSLLFDGYNDYDPQNPSYNYPPLGILLKANVKDLFEDFEFEGGMRLPTTFNGTEFFVIFDNKKKRLDKKFAFYRRSVKNSSDQPNGVPLVVSRSKDITHIALAQFKYPLDLYTSIRATGKLRMDKHVDLATDRNALFTPSDFDQRISLGLEYVFDNTIDVSINIKNGTRAKVFAEVVKKFDLEIVNSFNLNLEDGFMTVLGIDARHYQRLDKHSILAVRAAASTSFGSEKMLYVLGGVDNWLFQQQNTEIPYPQSDDFAYQTLASNMRGFRFNIRNGNHYALVNTELRVPIFKYFSKRIRSSFIRNFQLVGFFDVGTAWQGPTPFTDDSPLNTIFLTKPPAVSVKVNYFRDPIVAGYGGGIRTTLFGYFLRLDYAWGVETRIVQDPILYFSMGMDF